MTAELTLIGHGAAGNSLGVGTDLVNIVPGKGRWIVSGIVRHSLADGVLFSQGPTASVTIKFRIPNGPNTAVNFGPFIVDMLNNTDSFVLELGVATGASDTAYGLLFAQRTSPI